MVITPQDIDFALRLATACILGGLIGYQREMHGKDAGFRTYTIVCLGSALIMLVSTQVYEIYKGAANIDPARIAAQVVSGIGFLGAGAVIRDRAGVRGLTTAAGIWAAAGIGLACGLGQYKPAILTTVLLLLTLTTLSRIDRHLQNRKV